jgi:hypothetical protein
MTDGPKGLYRHYKGDLYVVIGGAIHTETEESLVVYRHQDSGKVWARPAEMFFGTVDVDGTVVPRFTKMASRRTLGRGAGN